MRTPRDSGFSMPPEWARHERTWMELPPANDTFGDGSLVGGGAGADLARFRAAWAAVANTIARFEPVSMVCNPGDGEIARGLVDSSVTIHEAAIDDAWFRDSGPTFLLDDAGRLGATHWSFNAWGKAKPLEVPGERRVGAWAAGLADATLFASRMVNEGGGIHVDGEGTVMITRTVQLDPDRNPGWDEASVEAELRSYLGIQSVIWLPCGLTRDYDVLGTRGHIDIVAAFVSPGVVVAHRQTDPAHPDFEVCCQNFDVLRHATDARGRRLEVVPIDAPTVTFVDDEPVDWSYINHYVCNGAVILCSFADEVRDAAAADTLVQLYPGRRIVLVDARPIFECGGGVHCITQQQPASLRSAP